MRSLSVLRSAIVGLLLLAPTVSFADAIVVTRAATASTIAEIFIEETSIRVELEIGYPDLPAFRNLMPTSLVERMGFEAEALDDRLPRFFSEDLTFAEEGGAPLPGRVVEIGPEDRLPRDELTGEPRPLLEGEEAEPVIRATLEYRMPEQVPALVMTPPRSPAGSASASIGFIAYHLGLPLLDFRYFGVPATLDLNWEDPWYSRFRNRNLKRQYDAPINVFLYVEPYEVRTEIIARPLDIQRWLDLGLDARGTIPVEAQQDVKMQVAEFLTQHQNVLIDGQPAEPTLDRVHFLRRTLRNSTVIDPPEELPTVSATLGVIFVFPVEGLPEEASLTWDLFDPPQIGRVPAAATDEAGPLRFFLQPDDNVLWWKNFLQNPTIPTLVDVATPPGWAARSGRWVAWFLGAVALVVLLRLLTPAGRRRGAGRGVVTAACLTLVACGVFLFWWKPGSVDDEAAEEILGSLLHNVYRSFDFREESTIYDVLERSVTGDLLTQTYLETRRGLELASQGGARAKVKELELIDVSVQHGRDGGFVARCSWNVSGSVGHWGHVHRRTNQYEADIAVEPVDGQWKITALDLLQEVRL